jgi:hypothetical protein
VGGLSIEVFESGRGPIIAVILEDDHVTASMMIDQNEVERIHALKASLEQGMLKLMEYMDKYMTIPEKVN